MSDSKNTHSEDVDLDGFEAPEDDFDSTVDIDDASDGVADADFQDVDDTSDVDADVFGEAPPAEPAPKRGVNWFNIGVAVVALAVAGGLIWSKLGPQLMNKNTEAPVVTAAGSSEDSVSMKAESEAAVQAAVSATPGASNGAGLLDNPDQFAAMNQQASMPAPEPQPLSADPFASLGDTETPDAQNTSNIPVSGGVPMPTPISGAPVPETTTTQTTVTETTTTGIQPAPVTAVISEAVPAAVALVTPVASGEDTSALKAQMSAMEQKLAALDTKVSAAVEKIAATPAGIDDSRLAAIQTTLERLESRMDGMSSKPATPVRAVAAVEDDAPDVIVQKTPVKKASKPKAKAVKADAKWNDAYSPAAAPKTVAVSTGGAGWQLRGAQTGRAIIAKGGDMREIGVGENVPGLGEITGIASINGRWVVQGTQGRLSQ